MLQHLSLRYDPVEDRLALRLVVRAEGDEQVERWLHLTRRTCAAWRLDLQSMVDMSAEVPDRLDGAGKAALSKAHHQAMAAQVAVRTESADKVPMPPQAPSLVKKIVCGRRRRDGRWTIRFEIDSGPPLGLVLSGQTLHGLVSAVFHRIQVADWGLAPLPLDVRDKVELQGNSQIH